VSTGTVQFLPSGRCRKMEKSAIAHRGGSECHPPFSGRDRRLRAPGTETLIENQETAGRIPSGPTTPPRSDDPASLVSDWACAIGRGPSGTMAASTLLQMDADRSGMSPSPGGIS